MKVPWKITLNDNNEFMIGQLSPGEVEAFLQRQVIGRIGCHDGDVVYVVPISYAYDHDCIYCHTYEGKKMAMMRRNPQVCFEVDETDDMANWKSVIGWGKFEELTDRDTRTKALRLLLQRRLPVMSSVTTHLGKTWPFTGDGSKGYNEIPGIVFKICLEDKSGRFETAPVANPSVA